VAGVIQPKVERASDVRAVDQALADRERPGHSLSLILLLETPAGVLRVAALVDCGVRRVAALAFGAEDYRAGMGVDSLDPVSADFARATIANAAAAAHLPAIDAPYLQINDLDRLRTAARRARSLGFTSKFAIHPSQLPVIHEELGGGDDRAWAERVVQVYERAVGEGKGSVALEGRMIDAATMKRARDILKA
jgi:citrate lyase subunit beta/citryl-CoA lyase